MDGSSCRLHPGEHCKIEGVDLCVMGSPCPPFSTQRSKRFHDGTVTDHPLYSVTFHDARDAIVDGGHKAIILEQVEGFAKPQVVGDELSPMERQATRFVSGCQLIKQFQDILNRHRGSM